MRRRDDLQGGEGISDGNWEEGGGYRQQMMASGVNFSRKGTGELP